MSSAIKAPPVKTTALQFPSLGVVRLQPHEIQFNPEGYPTPWSVNARLEESLTGRLRGGSFTGISAGARTDPVFRDRAITFSSNAITAARQGDSTDTTLSSDLSDTARPIRLQLSEAGATGGTVVAVVPHKDAHLLGFTAGEAWVLAGDPATGTMRRISDEVGIIGEDAWCVNHDTVYFMSSDGLYSVGADGGGLKPVSESRLPDELSGLSDSTCTLTYQHSDRGVYIHLASGVDWYYDTDGDAFWPFDTSTTDSHVLIGPLRIGSPTGYGLIQTIHGVIAENSGRVDWRIVASDTAEEASVNGRAAITAALEDDDYSQYVSGSGSWNAGRSKASWPRVRCAWCVIWLSSNEVWAYEQIILEATPWGRIR